MESALQVFTYKAHQVRTVIISGEIWFVAKDVCDILEITKYRDAISKLDDDERGLAKVDTLGGTRDMAIISEPGLYTLLMKTCRKRSQRTSPSARRTTEQRSR